MAFDPRALTQILGAVGGLRGGSNAFSRRWQQLEAMDAQRRAQEQQMAQQAQMQQQQMGMQRERLDLDRASGERAAEQQRMGYAQSLRQLFTDENVDPDVALQLATMAPPQGYDVGAVQSMHARVFTPDERTRRKAAKRLKDIEADPQIKRLMQAGEDVSTVMFEAPDLGGNPEDPQGAPRYTVAQLQRMAQKPVPVGPLPKAAAETPDLTKSSIDVQAADALRRGDTEAYNRLLRVKKEIGQADDRPTQGSDPEIAALRKDLLRIQVENAGKADEPNQSQFTAATYAGRMEQAESALSGVQNYVTTMRLPSFELQTNSWFARPTFQSDEVQSYMQGARNFINSVLRRESGAVISPSEFAEARQQYLPQPGDTPQVLAQKRANRRYVFEQMRRASGSAYQPPPQVYPPLTRDAQVGQVYLHQGRKVRVREKTRTGFLFDEVAE